MSLFWIDNQRGVELTYDDLLTELEQRSERHPVVYSDDPSEVLIEVVFGMLAEGELTLLDPEFSDETLDAIGVDVEMLSETEPAPAVDVDTPEALLSWVEETNDEWNLTLYTSGTTGVPSSVSLSFEGLTRSVRRDDRFSDHVWAFAYNPTHLAGLQVFFQAFFNANPMVYVFESQPDQIGSLIEEYDITHISATPTFYRLRLQRLTSTYESVIRLTSGGEKFEPSLQDTLFDTFPNANFRNVYAVTEAGTLLESEGELFDIPDRMSDKIEIKDNELVIHESLLDITDSMDIDDGWFHTGDIVEFVDDDSFRFVGRSSDFINVGGYRVNPHEVERRINAVEGIEAAVISARESSITGHILVAKVKLVDSVDSETAKQRIKDAIRSLERWKQPRVIDIVGSISQTRSGKRVRGDDQ